MPRSTVRRILAQQKMRPLKDLQLLLSKSTVASSAQHAQQQEVISRRFITYPPLSQSQSQSQSKSQSRSSQTNNAVADASSSSSSSLIERNTQVVELLQALDNVRQVQKHLGLEYKTRETRRKELLKWKASLDGAISKNDIRLAKEIFYSPPDTNIDTDTGTGPCNINMHMNMNADNANVNSNANSNVNLDDSNMNDIGVPLFKTYENLANRLRPDEIQTMFEIYVKVEELYSNMQQASEEEQLSKDIVRKRLRILNRLIKMVKNVQIDPNSRSTRTGTGTGTGTRNSVSFKKYMHIVNDLSTTIQCIVEPEIQQQLYPALIKNFHLAHHKMKNLRGWMADDTRQTERELWDNALFSLNLVDDRFFEMADSDDDNDSDSDSDNKNEINSENKNDTETSLRLYSALLGLSTYRKRDHFPFLPLMNLLVRKGAALSPDIVLNVVQNDYPFESIHSVRDTLKSLLYLQRTKSKSTDDFILDMGTLEHLCCIAARKGSSKTFLVLLNFIQEVRDSGNEFYHPTQGIYESLAQSFMSSSQREDQKVFGVLKEMESIGFQPSHIFLRGLAQSIRTRSTVGRLDAARHMILSGYEGTETSIATTSGLNVIIAGYADLGFIDKAYLTYSMFEELDCKPDENTFAYLLEAVAMDISTAIPPKFDHQEHEWIVSKVDIADALIEEARAKGFLINKHMLHSYISVLCAANSLGNAKQVINEVIFDAEEYEITPPIGVETFSILALKYAENGDFESLDDIMELSAFAGFKEGLAPHVTKQIDRIRKMRSI